jgi:hypothetical protein
VRAYRSAVIVFSSLFIVLGFVILVRTAFAGGGVGYIFGVLFVALGAGRLAIARRR